MRTKHRHAIISLVYFTLTLLIAFWLLSPERHLRGAALASEGSVAISISPELALFDEDKKSFLQSVAPDDVSKLKAFKYRYAIDIAEPPNTAYSLYMPALGGHAIVNVNAVKVSARALDFRQYFAPTFRRDWMSFDIRRNLWLPGKNRVDVIVGIVDEIPRAPTVYAAPALIVQRAISHQRTIEYWLPAIAVALGLITMSINLISMSLARQKVTFLLLALIAGVTVLMGFASSYTAPAVFVSASVTYTVLYPFASLALLGLLVASRRSARSQHSLETGLIWLAIAGPMFALISMALPWLHSYPLFTANFALATCLPLIVLLTLKHSLRDLYAYRSTLSSLRARIGKQAVALDEKSRIIAEEMQRRAILEERQRVMRDIHDGIGGQLLSLLLRVRTGSMEKADIAADIQASLNDLRLVVDSIDHVGGDLTSALATFRSRAERQMIAAGLRLDWQQSDDLPKDLLSAADTLQLYRFMQEALTNIIRHAEAKQARVRIEQSAAKSHLLVETCDDGKGLAEPPETYRGKGLKNMADRAQRLGGGISFKTPQTGSGLCIALTIPTSKP